VLVDGTVVVPPVGGAGLVWVVAAAVVVVSAGAVVVEAVVTESVVAPVEVAVVTPGTVAVVDPGTAAVPIASAWTTSAMTPATSSAASTGRTPIQFRRRGDRCEHPGKSWSQYPD
jgi:hypothetical protein